jgi:hypothetical protein
MIFGSPQRAAGNLDHFMIGVRYGHGEGQLADMH